MVTFRFIALLSLGLGSGLVLAQSATQGNNLSSHQLLILRLNQTHAANLRPVTTAKAIRGKGAAKEYEPLLKSEVSGKVSNHGPQGAGFYIESGSKQERTEFPGTFDHIEYAADTDTSTVFHVPPKVSLEGRLDGLRDGEKAEETAYAPDY